MELFGSRWVRQCEHLARVARRMPGGGLLGRRRSRLPAGGTEACGHRDYSPGDDYRSIDWRQCARHDELLTRQYPGETDLRVYLLLDASRSMALGQPAKFDVARRITAALAYVALADHQRVAVTTFADGVVDDCAPIGQRAEYLKVLRFLNSSSSSGPETELRRVTAALARRYQRRGLVVVISDLYDRAGFEHGIDVLRLHGYAAAVVQVYDPADSSPPAPGDLELIDAENDSALQVTVTERMRARYCALFDDFQDGVRDHCASRGVPCLQLPVDEPEEELLFAAIAAVGAREIREGHSSRRLVPSRSGP